MNVVLVCDVPGCPRHRNAEVDPKTVPAGTAVIKSRCPWHQSGDFESEIYLDFRGKQILDPPCFEEPEWKPEHQHVEPNHPVPPPKESP